MSLVIRAAARTLPAGIRDRYREQWLADARDAAEAGLRPSSIALAALSFAVTLDRPLPWGGSGELTPQAVDSRSRLAAALALSAALLGVAHFTSLYGFGALTGSVVYDTVIEMVDTVLIAFVVVATIVAVVMVARTKSMAPRVRLAVLLLVLAVLSPLGRIVLDYFPITVGEIYFGLGGLAYLAGALVVAVALRLLWTNLPRPAQLQRPTRRATALASLAVLVVGGLALAQALVMWLNRAPMVWSWEPGRATTIDEDGTVVSWDIPVTQADYEQWLSLNAQFELLVTVALVVFAIAVVASVIMLAGLARAGRARPVPLAIAAIAVELIGLSALLQFMGWTEVPLLVSTAVMLAAGRVLLVGTTLVAVGGVRYLPRVGHRHDVEGAVELL